MPIINTWNTFEEWVNESVTNGEQSLSPVVDTGQNGSIISSVIIDFDSPNGSYVILSFRASENEFEIDDTDVQWTQFTTPNQILKQIETTDLGTIKGRYYQVRARLIPSITEETPILKSLTINTSVSEQLIFPSSIAYETGKTIGQIIEFSGTKKIDKVSLNLSVVSKKKTNFIVGQDTRIAWQAINFQSSRDEWVFQPIAGEWVTNGISIQNKLQTQSYSKEDNNAYNNAPKLSYEIFFPYGGIWNLWGYGNTPEGIYYSIDNSMQLGELYLGIHSDSPYWTKAGTVYFEEGGLHTFTIYLSENAPIILDQWLFTSDSFIDGEDEVFYRTPTFNSFGPFMTVVRLRELEEGHPSSLTNESAINVSFYKSSNSIVASGKYNYNVQTGDEIGLTFDGGLSIEFMQIGGGANHFASWNKNI